MNIEETIFFGIISGIISSMIILIILNVKEKNSYKYLNKIFYQELEGKLLNLEKFVLKKLFIIKKKKKSNDLFYVLKEDIKYTTKINIIIKRIIEGSYEKEIMDKLIEKNGKDYNKFILWWRNYKENIKNYIKEIHFLLTSYEKKIPKKFIGKLMNLVRILNLLEHSPNSKSLLFFRRTEIAKKYNSDLELYLFLIYVSSKDILIKLEPLLQEIRKKAREDKTEKLILKFSEFY